MRRDEAIATLQAHEAEQKRLGVEHVAYDVLWRVVHDSLPPLGAVCRAELAAEQTRTGKQD